MNHYGMLLGDDVINYFQAESLKSITSKNAKNELEKKHIDILISMDLTPYQIIIQDENPLYILYDNSRGSFYAFVNNIEEVESYTNSTIKGLVYLLPEDYFKDYELDREKVFNDDILNYSQCLLNDEYSSNAESKTLIRRNQK